MCVYYFFYLLQGKCEESDYETIVQCAQRSPKFKSNSIANHSNQGQHKNFIDLTLDLMDDNENAIKDMNSDDKTLFSQSACNQSRTNLRSHLRPRIL